MIHNIAYKSKEWYEFRKNRLGGSDVGAILGVNPYMSNIELWGLKTGLKEPKDLSSNELAEYGLKAEEHLSKLFQLDFPEYEFIDTKNIVITNDDHDFIMVSPDGLLREKQTNEKGFWECKTVTEKNGRVEKELTINHIPDNHYCQIIHTFLADKDLTFCIIEYQIKHITENGENCYKETLHKKIYRKEVEEDINQLEKIEIEFIGYVKRKEKPPFRLKI